MLCNTIQINIPACQALQYNFEMTFDPERFAKALRELWAASPYKTQSALAEAADIQRSSVSAYMNARPQSITGNPSQPTPETVIALAKALNADADYLLLLAGHAPQNYERGHFKGVNRLTPEQKQVIQQTIDIFLEKAAAEENPDTDYIDDDFKG
ncbi:MAG: helix-turn-helix domain-containing protein [Acidobacteria bacterium]|nr:helix-turn-helix domain-containing protein [Acidobacteriota bacterium]